MASASQPKPTRSLPLQLVLIAPFFALVVIAVGWVGYLSYRNSQQAVNNVARQLRGEITARIAEHLLDFLDTPHRINQLNANTFHQGMLPAAGQEVLAQHFWEQVQVFDSVTSIYFGNTAGGFVGAGREGAGGALYKTGTVNFVQGPFQKYATDNLGNKTDLLITVPNFDPRTRPWYTGAVAKDGATWSSVYILTTGQDMAIAASRPVYDDGQNLMGVVSIDLFVGHVSNFLKTLEIGKTGQSFIMERSGLLVAASTPGALFTGPDANNQRQRLSASESANPIIRQAAAALTQRFGDYHAITNAQQLDFKLDGQQQFLQVSPVQDAYGIDWLIVVVIPEADFMAEIHANNRAAALLVSAAILFCLGIGVLTARRISQPIVHLNTSTQALAQGEWHPIQPVGGIKETHTLTLSFNRMAEQLQQTLANLSTEIDEHKQAEAALRESEERYRQLFDLESDAIFLIENATGRLLESNKAATLLYGYSREELLEMKNTDLSAEPEETQRVTQGSPVVEAQLVFIPLRMHRRKDGAVFPVEITGRFFTWRERAVHIAAIRDITARLEAEASLTESQQLYHDLVETAQDLIWQCDAEGRYTYLNPAWETVFGYAVEEMLGQSFTQFQSPDYAAQDRELFRQLLTGKTITGHETIHLSKDGHEIHLVFNAKAIWNADGAIYGVRGTAYDVSERKRVELALQENNARLQALNAELRQTQDQLVQSQKMESVGRLAAGIAHDFRNILTSIVLYAQMPLRKQRAAPGLPPDVIKALETILSESRRASDLVQQILDFSRRTMLKLRPVSLPALVQETLTMLQRTLPESITITLTGAADEAIIQADANHIQQALVNLAVNARDAMPEGGELRFTLSRFTLAPDAPTPAPDMPAGEWLCLSVADTGVGMTDEVRAHLFEPYFTTKPVGHGTGLGLAQVYGTIRQHDGYIGVETAPGQGSTFSLYLPVYRMEMVKMSHTAQATEPTPARGETLLLVEDNPVLREVSCQILESLGYRVFSAADGREALNIYQRESNIALVITDIVMPGISGKVLMQTLKALTPAVKVLGITGYAVEEISGELQAAGFCGIIHKPFEIDALAQVVQQVLDVGDRNQK